MTLRRRIGKTRGRFAEAAATALSSEGAATAAAGVEELGAAQDAGRAGVAATAAAANDLTRGMDAAVVADRLATLSGVVATA